MRQLLVAAIRQTHEYIAAQVGRAVSVSLTLRNWVIGCYIREYEQNGADRAEYGTQVLEHLGRVLQKSLDRCYNARYLRLCRRLYTGYPQIRMAGKREIGDFLIANASGSQRFSHYWDTVRTREDETCPYL